MNKLLVRLKGQKIGSHTHVSIWLGQGERMPEDRYSHLGHSGDIIVRNEDWQKLVDLMSELRDPRIEGKVTEGDVQ